MPNKTFLPLLLSARMKFLFGAILLATCLAGSHADNPLVATTMEFLARASSTSEVLTLNLTNLFILGLLAAAVAFGVFAGTDGSTARSADNDVSVLTQSALTGGMCFMMYTSGTEEKLSCIQRSACEDPKTATDYLTAAKMWYKIHKLMK